MRTEQMKSNSGEVFAVDLNNKFTYKCDFYWAESESMACEKIIFTEYSTLQVMRTEN